MNKNRGGVWKCPVCGSGFANDWKLACHIGGMAISYYEHHREWAVSRVPDVDDTISPGAAGSMLRPFLVDAFVPHELTAAPELSLPESLASLRDLLAGFPEPTVSPDLSGSELVANLTEGYQLVASLEIQIHQFVVQRLKDEHGDVEWWAKGVPRTVRTECSKRCEEDDNRYERWLYLDLLHLKNIIDNSWPAVFQRHAEGLKDFPGKGQFLKLFENMNTLRNQIMHPLKGKPLGQDDFDRLRTFSRRLDEFVGEP